TARLVAALVAVILFANIVLFIGFLLLVTPLIQQRSQSSLLHQFRASLVLDSTPDLITPPAGNPIGVLEIPSLGTEQVMVQGIASDDTKLGPGHDPSTPAPGQAGNAVVFGRSVTYGAPFSKLTDLRPGDDINVVTRQGRFTYQVAKSSQMPLGDRS